MAMFINLVLVSLLTACHDNSPNESKNSDQSKKHTIVNTPDAYQANIETPSSTQASTSTEAKIDELLNPEESIAAKQDAPENLILELGFSEAQDGNVDTSVAPNYCLDKSAESGSKPDLSSENICKKVSNRLASVSMQGCLDAKLVTNGCESVKGFPIVTRTFL